MKKQIAVAAAVLVCGAVAFAGTIQIPFFLDNGTGWTAGYPDSGTATFICIKNPSTSASLTITVRYFENDGTEYTPTPNTYTIDPGAAVSWRPVASHSSEGVGQAVPDKDGGASSAGTAIITYTATDPVIGRVAVLRGNPDTMYAFLITE